MKIITWNVNGYRSITGQNPSKRYDKVSKDNKLFAYIEIEKPDIICLQETKADESQIDDNLKAPEGYTGFYHSCKETKGYSGVATFTKIKPKSVNMEIGVEKFDDEGRVIELEFDKFILFNIYFPKGYAASERLDYKLEFYDRLFAFIKKPKYKNKKIIICGDYNTAHKEIDLARPGENHGTSGFMPVERVKLDWMVENGFIDTFREFSQETGVYSWWSQRGRARDNNVGWRIDYHFVTANLKDKLINCTYQPDIMGSDHCPVVLEINL
jgi:exodeoxyribonuclease III